LVAFCAAVELAFLVLVLGGVEVHFFEQVDIEGVGDVWIEDHVLPIIVHQRWVGALVTEGHEVVAMPWSPDFLNFLYAKMHTPSGFPSRE
jgi:hypothetical protein